MGGNLGGNAIQDKSFWFATRIVKFSRWLKTETKDYSVANQILRSGTSIGANVAEAQYAQSNKDFASKMHIALKEAAETKYWLRLLISSETTSERFVNPLLEDIDEILKLLTTIVKSANK